MPQFSAIRRRAGCASARPRKLRAEALAFGASPAFCARDLPPSSGRRQPPLWSLGTRLPLLGSPPRHGECGAERHQRRAHSRLRPGAPSRGRGGKRRAPGLFRAGTPGWSETPTSLSSLSLWWRGLTLSFRHAGWLSALFSPGHPPQVDGSEEKRKTIPLQQVECLMFSFKHILRIDNLHGLGKLVKLQLDNNLITKARGGGGDALGARPGARWRWAYACHPPSLSRARVAPCPRRARRGALSAGAPQRRCVGRATRNLPPSDCAAASCLPPLPRRLRTLTTWSRCSGWTCPSTRSPKSRASTHSRS